MEFSSIDFIAFFGVLALLLWATKIPFIVKALTEEKLCKFRHITLLIFSYIFYGWWDWRFCFLMLSLTAIAYLSARSINEGKHPKRSLALGVAFPLVILGFFKYFNFFLSSFMALFSIKNVGALDIILPVGISFYTFQSMSFTIDVYRGKIKNFPSFMHFALYVSFFPQLVAGPIVKASDFLPQLEEKHRNISIKNIEVGLQIFAFGLFKKVVIADHLSVFVDDVFLAPMNYHSISIILAVIAYSIQIYCDFSGYSDMAVGCAKCIGYDLMRNFNLPYISKNVSEFWKRWHISLSSWLMEYLYIPLGGNRKGKARKYINLMLTMLLGGLWHGASWNFVIWGALHGGALCIHKIFSERYGKKGYKNTFTKIICAFATYVFVCICWVFFRSQDFSETLIILKKMVVWGDGIVQPYVWTFFSAIVVAVCTIVAIRRSRDNFVVKKGIRTHVVEGYYPIVDLTKFWSLFAFILFVGFTICIAYTGISPFIYFQF